MEKDKTVQVLYMIALPFMACATWNGYFAKWIFNLSDFIESIIY